MKCKSCGTELQEGQTVCPECGAAVKKSMPLGLKIGLIAAVCVVVIAGFLVGYKLLSKDDTPNTPAEPVDPSAPNAEVNPTDGGTAPDGTETPDTQTPGTETPAAGVSYSADSMTDEELDAIVATYGDHTLSNRQLAYYYWYGYTAFCSNYSDYLAYLMDPTQPLDTQIYDQTTGQTWQQFFLEQALASFKAYSAMADAADAAGYELDSSMTDYLDTLADNFASYAESAGLDGADAYAQYVFGPGADVAGYTEFMRAYMVQGGYGSELYNSFDPTDEEVETYYDENAETYAEDGVAKDETVLVNVRHILIQPSDTSDDSAWESAEGQANTLLQQWKDGEATEDSFAELATTWTSDLGSKETGGLYENVYPGQMVAEFNDWCFDEARQVGDTAVVKTDYGYHIMYFSGKTDTLFWRYRARLDLISQLYQDAVKAQQEQHTLETNYDAIGIVTPDGLKVS